MKLIIAIVLQLAVIGQPPAPQLYSAFLPYVPVAAAPQWRTVFTAQGKPFTDAVLLNGALVVSRQDGNIYRDSVLWAQVPVNATGEGGLNALATDGRRLWAGYVSPQSRIVVAEIVNGVPAVLADFGTAATEHNAAGLLYSNGRLLFGIGDNENAYTAQSATLPNGKLWWIDPTLGDVTPAAKGLRNPWHITQIGTQIFISDVGESKYEEVNTFTQGANYGWPCYEAFEARVYDPELCDPLAPGAGSVAPVMSYGRNMGRGIVGVASINGAMVYADFSGAVRTFSQQPVRVVDGYITKMTTTGAGIVVLTMKGGVSGVDVWR